MPPVSKHMIAGHLVPTFKSLTVGQVFSKQRRVALEVYGPEDEEEAEASVVNKIGPNDLVAFRILKQGKLPDETTESQWNDAKNDDHSLSEVSASTIAGDVNSGWVERYKCRLDAVSILEVVGSRNLQIQLGVGRHTKVRDLHFASKPDLQDFVERFEGLKSLQAERAQRLVNTHRSKSGILSRGLFGDGADDDKGVAILLEIVSASHLPVTDYLSSDPYIKVMDGDRELHRTATISKK